MNRNDTADTSVYYSLALDMEALALKFLQAGEQHEDGTLEDIGLTLMDDSRKMVKEMITFWEDVKKAIEA